MAGERVRSVLRGIDFRPFGVVACQAKERDKWGRVQYRPLVEGTLGGTLVRILPLDCGVFLSPGEAIEQGEKWSELV